MSEDLNKIETFIAQHHVLNLATSNTQELRVCSLFYCYDKEAMGFVFASSEDTTHIKHIKQDSNVAGTIVLETNEVGKIQGLQFFGKVKHHATTKQQLCYFKTFPYAVALQPQLWFLQVEGFKLTDNRLGFGKKIIYP